MVASYSLFSLISCAVNAIHVRSPSPTARFGVCGEPGREGKKLTSGLRREKVFDEFIQVSLILTFNRTLKMSEYAPHIAASFRNAVVDRRCLIRVDKAGKWSSEVGHVYHKITHQTEPRSNRAFVTNKNMDQNDRETAIDDVHERSGIIGPLRRKLPCP